MPVAASPRGARISHRRIRIAPRQRHLCRGLGEAFPKIGGQVKTPYHKTASKKQGCAPDLKTSPIYGIRWIADLWEPG